MADYHAISKQTHADKRWQRFRSYQFAAADVLVALVVDEFPKAMMNLPIGFVQQDSQDQKNFSTVALLGFSQGKNLFVAPDGRWLSGYVPAAFRAYPFLLAAQDDQKILCIDHSSGLVADAEGEIFFDENGEPSQAITDILALLGKIAESKEATQRICDVLQQHNLIQVWPITLPGTEGEQNLGLYRIDEAALNLLSSEAFEEIRQAGALPVVYCQLLSMQNLARVNELSKAHTEHEKSAQTSVAGFLEDEGSLNFDNLE
jgi:hypothetical protein